MVVIIITMSLIGPVNDAISTAINQKTRINHNSSWLSLLSLKKGMSQSSWQIGKPDLNAFFLNVFFFFFFSEQQTCQIWVGHSFEIWNLTFGWTRYKTEHRVEKVCCSKCFIVSVMSFLVHFDKQVHKKLEKN